MQNVTIVDTSETYGKLKRPVTVAITRTYSFGENCRFCPMSFYQCLTSDIRFESVHILSEKTTDVAQRVCLSESYS